MALPPPGKDSAAIVSGASSGNGEQFAGILARRGYGWCWWLAAPTASKGSPDGWASERTRYLPTCPIEWHERACRTASRLSAWFRTS